MRYPPISDYGLIADCHGVALVSRTGSIDWCCLPRVDDGSCFGRLLDWERGGYCSIAPVDPDHETSRRYLDGTMVLETTFEAPGGKARLIDCMTVRRGGARNPYRQILRVVEGVSGTVELRGEICPRFDYGELRPWIRQEGVQVYSAIGGNDALLFSSDADIAPGDEDDLQISLVVRGGERVRLSIEFIQPEELDLGIRDRPDPPEMDRRLDQTIRWWRRWSRGGSSNGPVDPGALRSAMVLKSLIRAPTGALAAAATTSLPEVLGGGRNWDYRFSWIRDSSFSVQSLAELGFEREADGFRRFIERSAAGHAEELQIMYGVGGERRLTEFELDFLHGYRGSRPVRIGNAAAKQRQLDVYGEVLDLAWRWHLRGHSIEDDYWRFLVELVEMAVHRWREPDRGIWEAKGRPKHYVHSKVMCWLALDRGIELANDTMRQAPVRRWTKVRDEIRRAVERRGYDRRRGVFVRDFDSKAMDAALLLLPRCEFIAYDDERMVRTTDAIREDLEDEGLLYRYRVADALDGREGAFLPCSFWLVECLAGQGRVREATEVFDRASATANDLGLFSEEFDPATGEMLGNFPQALTHLSHIAAMVALSGAGEA